MKKMHRTKVLVATGCFVFVFAVLWVADIVVCFLFREEIRPPIYCLDARIDIRLLPEIDVLAPVEIVREEIENLRNRKITHIIGTCRGSGKHCSRQTQMTVFTEVICLKLRVMK